MTELREVQLQEVWGTNHLNFSDGAFSRKLLTAKIVDIYLLLFSNYESVVVFTNNIGIIEMQKEMHLTWQPAANVLEAKSEALVSTLFKVS